MTNGYKLSLAAIAASITLVGCGSDSDSTATAVAAETVTGQFVDTYVAGLNYACSSGTTGVTNNMGEYTCNVGDTVEFSLGGYVLGSATASSGIVTPETLYPDNPEAALNVAQVIQSLDTDPTDDIITIPENFTGLDAVTTTPEDANFDALIEDVLDVPLVTEEEAQAHLDETEVMLLLAGKTFYVVGQALSDITDTWAGAATFNTDLTEVTFVNLDGPESEVSSIRFDGDTFVFVGDTDGSYTVIGDNKGDYIEVTDYFSDGTAESNTRFYFDEAKARAYLESITITLESLISGKTFYTHKGGVDDYLSSMIFNSDATSVTITTLDGPFSGDSRVQSTIVVGNTLGIGDGSIVFTGQTSDYLLFGESRLYFDQTTAEAYYASVGLF